MSAVTAGRCPVCGDPLGDGALSRCAECDTAVHAACGVFLGGCARYACPEAASSRRRMRRYLFERIRHDLAIEAFAVVLFGLSAWILHSWIVLLAALIHVPPALAQIARMRKLRGADPVLVDLLRQYPPVLQDEWTHVHGPFVQSLRSGLGIGAGIVLAGLIVAVPLLWMVFGLGEALRLWMIGSAVFGFLSLLFGAMFGAAIAIFELLVGTRRGQPRWAPLAEAWQTEILEWTHASNPHLIAESKKGE
jgi:hypothetical protein